MILPVFCIFAAVQTHIKHHVAITEQQDQQQTQKATRITLGCLLHSPIPFRLSED